MLIALRVWSEFWKYELAVVRVKSDSKAALAAFERERSASAAINTFGRELALERAVAVFEPVLEFVHVRGKNNEWADALSRLSEPGKAAVIPGPLRCIPRCANAVRDGQWWRTASGPAIFEDTQVVV